MFLPNGNWDRHNGNWGFLYNNDTDEITLAPVYDCGSCLFPQADEEIMKKALEDPAERDLRVFEIPLSGIKINGQKIRYFDFISSLQNRDCNRALKRLLPKIDMEKINQIVEETPFTSNLQKTFYKTMLKERKERLQRIRRRPQIIAEPRAVLSPITVFLRHKPVAGAPAFGKYAVGAVSRFFRVVCVSQRDTEAVRLGYKYSVSDTAAA